MLFAPEPSLQPPGDTFSFSLPIRNIVPWLKKYGTNPSSGEVGAHAEFAQLLLLSLLCLCSSHVLSGGELLKEPGNDSPVLSRTVVVCAHI